MQKNGQKLKRALALFFVVLLLFLFAATLLVGIFGGADQAPLLRALIFLDVVVPVILYGFLLITKQFRKGNDQDREPKGKG